MYVGATNREKKGVEHCPPVETVQGDMILHAVKGRAFKLEGYLEHFWHEVCSGTSLLRTPSAPHKLSIRPLFVAYWFLIPHPHAFFRGRVLRHYCHYWACADCLVLCSIFYIMTAYVVLTLMSLSEMSIFTPPNGDFL